MERFKGRRRLESSAANIFMVSVSLLAAALNSESGSRAGLDAGCRRVAL